ncbi:helix-turn-helix domain-containing protein [Rhodocytophaga rosea]|uniref:Helix-turn-helix domain-containing protein n=1 Tax=Rhodocytophaga rosea TaxID=2704465 RepID=A0A6C0GMZ2_9BACT|nr:helix-turn-helix domain-containing protein [Rhodocytophaga rosea]QHT68972.1 helix-turn-helix domain-containing protein [Rhodocytophaga rosea]
MFTINEILPFVDSYIRNVVSSEVRKALSERTINASVCATDENDECDIQEAALITGRSVATLYGDVHSRAIPVSRRGRKLVFSKKQLLDWKTPSMTADELDQQSSNYIVNRKK